MRQNFALPRDLSEALIRLARAEGVSLFTVLLAAWQTLLARYTEQTDIVVGSPIANRSRVETESLIGFFVNTLVLRTDFSGNPTFRELLEPVRSVVLDAQANQDVPFEKIVEELQLERSLSHTPLFQVVFALHNAPAQGIDLPDLKLAWLDVQRRTAKFDLMFELFERNGSINGSLEYSTDLFDDATITRLLGHYERLLSSIAANLDETILDLPLLSEAEERQLVYDWNAVAPYSTPKRLLHELFEDQAERTPGNVALVLDDEKLTYSELNAQANDLAQHLHELGVGPETLVGLFMERSIEMVVAVLGILKAAGAYVPLDIEHPKERLAFMLDDARPPVLLTQRRLIDRLPELKAVQAVCIDELSSRDGVRVQRKSGDAPLRPRGESPAYVIYTSGSTGTPKGVLVTHANLLRLFTSTQQWFNFNANDVWTLFHSYAFDFSVWELWGALLYGGRLVIVPYLVAACSVAANSEGGGAEEPEAMLPAPPLGPSRVLPQEYPNISYRSIDVVLHKTKGSQHRLVKQVIAEIVSGSPDKFVAYRGQHRWAQSFEPMRVAAPRAGELRLSQGGLYLITGGLDDLNLHLAELLARAARAKVLLAGRLDEASEWTKKLKEIEASGGEVLLANVDPENAQQLDEAIVEAQQRFGPLRGIFFNPNTATENAYPIRTINAEQCSARLRRIAHELANIESLTQESELDFCVLLSSLTTVVGGRGAITSAAANHIVDAFAHQQKQKAPGCCMSVNLDLKHLRNENASPADLRITRDQAAEVFRRGLSLNTISQVAVSAFDLREHYGVNRLRRRRSLISAQGWSAATTLGIQQNFHFEP